MTVNVLCGHALVIVLACRWSNLEARNLPNFIRQIAGPLVRHWLLSAQNLFQFLVTSCEIRGFLQSLRVLLG